METGSHDVYVTTLLCYQHSVQLNTNMHRTQHIVRFLPTMTKGGTGGDGKLQNRRQRTETLIDLLLLAKVQYSLQDTLNWLVETGRYYKLKIRENKSRVMIISGNQNSANHRGKPIIKECWPIQILRKFIRYSKRIKENRSRIAIVESPFAKKT